MIYYVQLIKNHLFLNMFIVKYIFYINSYNAKTTTHYTTIITQYYDYIYRYNIIITYTNIICILNYSKFDLIYTIKLS